MDTTNKFIVMNETAFAKLAVFPHQKLNHNHTNVFRWKYLNDTDVLMILEFKCGYMGVEPNYNYMEELCVYSAHKKNFERLYDIDPWLTNNICHFEKTEVIHNSTKEVLDKLMTPDVLGENDYYAGEEYGWNVKGKQMQAKIFLDMYKDPNQKTIKLQYTETTSKKTKNGMVDKKQLYAFLKKNLKLLKEKPLPIVKPQEIEKVTEKLEQTHIKESNIGHTVNPVPYHMLPQDEKEKLRSNSKLFINISKERRIAYQSCKPIRRKFDYLLEEAKHETSNNSN